MKLMTPYSQYEDDVIRRLYPMGGARAVVAELPERTLNMITSRATRLGVRLDPNRPRLKKKYPATRGTGRWDDIDQDEIYRRAELVRREREQVAGAGE